MTEKIAKYMLVAALLVIMTVTSGCALARGARAILRYNEDRNEHSAISNMIEAENMTANLSDVTAGKLHMDIDI